MQVPGFDPSLFDPSLFDDPFLPQLPPEAQVVVHVLRFGAQALRLLNLWLHRRWQCRCKDRKQPTGRKRGKLGRSPAINDGPARPANRGLVSAGRRQQVGAYPGSSEKTPSSGPDISTADSDT
jgi:hypothetical protein